MTTGSTSGTGSSTGSGGPGYWADTAAEAVRSLNHATLPSAVGLGGPADVHAVLGALACLAGRLPQALAQLQAFLDTECDAGRIAVVDGEFTADPVAAVSACGHWLEQAGCAADTLRHTLEQAHATLTWTASTDPPGPHRFH